MAAGAPSGIELARNLYAKTWISAHDEDKENKGLATKKVKIRAYTVDEIEGMLNRDRATEGRHKTRHTTKVVRMDAGEEMKIE